MMNEPRKAWRSALHKAPSVSLPQPSNENEFEDDTVDVPWSVIHPADPIPMMFSVDFSNGRSTCFAYSDLRVVDCISPSEIVLSLYSMEKTRLSITGRNLSELAHLLSLGQIVALHETEKADWFELSEAQPAIESVSVELLTGP
jgi:hypothetical protein